MGNDQAAQGNDADAIPHYQQAINLAPDFADAWANRGMAEARLGLNKAARIAFMQAAELMQQNSKALNTIGNQLFTLEAFEDAAKCYLWATKADPNFSNAWNNLGNTQLQLLKLGDAITAYEQAITIDPNHADARNGYAQALLMNGDFKCGWAAYEARFQAPDAPPRRTFSSPQWTGQNLDRKSILLYAEQGIGDTIQFLRFAKHLKDQNAQVIVECQTSIRNLIAINPNIDQAITPDDKPPQADFHAPLMSLPYLLSLTDTQSLQSPPYIQMKNSENKKPYKPRIGLVWAGNPDHINDANRSIPFIEFTPLLERPEFNFVSLQVGPARSQMQDTPLLPDLGKDFSSFTDTANALTELDLLITADTAIVHLAGAMGCPCWVLIPHVPDWRWMCDRADTPWYSSLRLFRQPQRSDWVSVINDLSVALDTHPKR